MSITTNPKLTRIELPDVEGHKVNLLKMPMPYPIAGRSTLTIFYPYEKEDETKVVISSSKGNEQLVEANQELIGKDVENINHITYTSSKTYEGGIELVHIVKMDP